MHLMQRTKADRQKKSRRWMRGGKGERDKDCWTRIVADTVFCRRSFRHFEKFITNYFTLVKEAQDLETGSRHRFLSLLIDLVQSEELMNPQLIDFQSSNTEVVPTQPATIRDPNTDTSSIQEYVSSSKRGSG